MKKIELKHVFIVALIIFFGFVFHVFYIGHNFGSVERNYLFFFKDSIHKKVDPRNSWASDQDNISNYIYYTDLKDKRLYYEINDTTYQNYYIKIWEIKSLKNYDLDDVFINKNSIIRNSKFEFQSTPDSSPVSDYEISFKYFYKIDGMILNLGENTKIIKEFKGENYKGFYALADKMSICNRKGEPQIYINFSKSLTSFILIMYKGHDSFYIVMINSNKEVAENIINILNID